MVVEVLHVALLMFVVTAGDVGVEGDILGQVIQTELLENLVP